MQKLIFISGETCTGKTSIANLLYKEYNNSAYLDGDDIWKVNPFSLGDPRLRNSDASVAFVLNNYLESNFEYVFLTSIILCDLGLRNKILDMIQSENYDLICFRLTSSEEILKTRVKQRDNVDNPFFFFLNQKAQADESIIDTTSGSIEDNVLEIKKEIEKRQ